MSFTELRVVRRRSSVASRRTPPPPRGGLTLVELLVVIVLISTLVSTAIPVISPGGEDRKLREASRNINAFFQGAQARAIETGRPFGVAMRRLSEETGRGDDNAVVTRLEYVEVPPPYSGFDESSLARVCVATDPTNGLRQLALQLVRYGSLRDQGTDRLPEGYDADLIPDRYLRPGDRVEVGGSSYVLRQPTNDTARLFPGWPIAVVQTLVEEKAVDPTAGYFRTSLEPAAGLGSLEGAWVFAIEPLGEGPPLVNDRGRLTLPYDLRLTHDRLGNELSSPEALARLDLGGETYFCTAPAPFKVYRQPIPAAGEPLELPSGIVVDLQSSTFVGSDITRLYQPSRSAAFIDDEFRAISDPAMVLFSPEGNVERAYLSDTRGLTVSSRVSDTMALCVGRRELMPPERLATALARPGTEGFDEPIDLVADLNGLTEEEAREVTDNYNWLNTESRWVVIGSQSGAIRTVETSSVFPSEANRNFESQLRAALDNVRSGSRAGGR